MRGNGRIRHMLPIARRRQGPVRYRFQQGVPAARSVQFAVTGCIDTVLVWLLARRNALSPVLRRIKTKGSEHRDA